jgi:hypothetical protein
LGAKQQQVINKYATDRILKMVNGVASGMDQTEAYLKFYSKKPTIPKRTATFQASRLFAKSEIQELLQQAREQRAVALKEELAKSQRVVAKEFIQQVLTVDQLDSFHSSVIQGFVNVEDHVPVYTVEEILNEDGKVIKRIRKPGLLPITRKPNIREKQVSVDALYKRNGNYAPGKIAGAFGNVNEDGELENIKRFVIMASGERVPMP